MKFWRRRHRHLWSNWEAPVSGKILVNGRTVGIAVVQFRSCTECGLRESHKTTDYLV